jgi:hypothetical protein
MQLLDCEVQDWLKRMMGYALMYGIEDKFKESFITLVGEPLQLCLWMPNYPMLGSFGSRSLAAFIAHEATDKLRYNCCVLGYRLICTKVGLNDAAQNKLKGRVGNGTGSSKDMTLLENKSVLLTSELINQLASG